MKNMIPKNDAFQTDKLIRFFDDVLESDHLVQSGEEVYWKCPFCKHKNFKLAINLKKLAWHCWVCGTSGRSPYGLLKKLRRPVADFKRLEGIIPHWEDRRAYARSSDENISVQRVSIPSNFIPLWISTNLLSYRHAISYLNQRQLGLSHIMKYQIGYCTEGKYENKIIIPSYDKHGILNYFVARSMYPVESPHQRAYDNPNVSKDIIMFENHIDWRMPVTLCEGVFDAMAIGRNAIPMLGKTPSSALIHAIQMNNPPKLILALDSDAKDASLKLHSKFYNMGIITPIFISKLDKKDPSDEGFESMIGKITNSCELGFRDILLGKMANLVLA